VSAACLPPIGAHFILKTVVTHVYKKHALKLESLIKVALDELRMQMLGVQVLSGLQFQGIFHEGFDDVSALGRRIDALGLALMVVVLGCLIAVPLSIELSSTARQRVFSGLPLDLRT
jgi:hypothetical protein